MSINKGKLLSYSKDIAKASIVGLIFTVIALLVQTAIMFFTDISESVLPVTSSIIMTLSVSISSIYASLKIRKKGWINGAIVGLVYIVVIITFSMILLDDFILNTYVLLKTIISLVTGIISGMIGVNLK